LTKAGAKGIISKSFLNFENVFQGVVMATDMAKEKEKAISLAISHIERQYGQGSIMKLGEEGARVRVEAISTGALNLDLATGIGGVPRGRVTEIFGPEASGKTTLALHVIANAQKTGGTVAFIDAEHALDPSYAAKLGVDLDNLLISQPDTGEQALDIAEVLVRSNAVDVVVIDSVAALVPRAEIEGEMGDSHMGLQARLIVNQIREKIGVMFGNPETTTGGRALKFYSSLRLDIRKVGNIKDAEQVLGLRSRVKVVKNKVAPPFRDAEFDIMFDKGISYAGTLLDLAVSTGIIEKSGAWFSYGAERLGQGRENVKIFLEENEDIFRAIDTEVKKKVGLLPGEDKEPEAQEGPGK
jgi:recombination protein RecA